MKIFKTIFLLIILSGSVFAQGIIFNMDPAKPFHNGSFTFSHPIPDEDIFTALTGTYNLNLNIKVAESSILHFGIPYNYIKYDLKYYDKSESGVGNIAVGFQSINDEGDGSYSAVQFFVYLPSADKDTYGIGVYNDFADFAGYLPDIYSILIHYAAHNKVTEDFGVNHYIGGSVLIAENDHVMKDDAEIFFRFAIEPYVTINNFNLFFLFKTVAIISQDVEDFSDRFQSVFGFGASLELDRYRPKLCYRVYLDEPAKDFIDGVLLLGLDFNLGE